MALAAAHAETLSRGAVHGANAVGFVAGCVQSQAALPARVAVLRRIGGPRAPRPGVILVADLSICALEVCATALLLGGALVAAGAAWWIVPISAAVASGVLCAARMGLRRVAWRSIVRGLAVFASPSAAGRSSRSSRASWR